MKMVNEVQGGLTILAILNDQPLFPQSPLRKGL
jgi:hypothetical protein